MYAVRVKVAAPIQVYDAFHAETLREPVQGLILHIGRADGAGFEITEVWNSKEEFERYNAEVIGAIAARLSGGSPPPALEQTAEEFEVRGLVIPNGGIVF